MSETKLEKRWHSLSLAATAKTLESDAEVGLAESEAATRLTHFGENRLPEKPEARFWQLAWEEFKSPLVYILGLAAVVATILRDFSDAILILLVVSVNTAIGVWEQKKAGRVLRELARSQRYYATVIRGGHRRRLPIESVVPGDLLSLSAGDLVPADARVVAERELFLNESVLTGEWASVKKTSSALRGKERITDRVNMVWKGSLVAGGTGLALVVATGRETYLGSLALSVAGGDSWVETPFQKSIAQLGRFLTGIIAGAVIVIFFTGLGRGLPLVETALTSVAVAVAAIPTGLPIAVTVVLAIGARSILRRGGLVKNLIAVETLGSTTTIITDKTGTLTKAEMTVELITPRSDAVGDREAVLGMAVMAAEAYAEAPVEPAPGEAETPPRVHGRPVEQAIVRAGLAVGLTQEKIFTSAPRLDFQPFDSRHRLAASLHLDKPSGNYFIYVTGAPEVLLKAAKFCYQAGRAKKISETDFEHFNQVLADGARRGIKFVATGYARTSEPKLASRDWLAKDFIFGGLIGLHDPLRPDAAAAIAEARAAGARVIMATGDNPITAAGIAAEAGIGVSEAEVVLGDEVEKMSDEALLAAASSKHIFARMLPEQKLRLLRLLQGRGEVVAMTGDGLNDVPALRYADIGVALGSGSAVAGEAADLVLLNDSFSIIVSSIKAGRKILDNLKKIVAYLLSTSFSEIILVGGALFFGWPLPLLPAQILWNNVIGESFMTFAFAFERAEPDIMRRDPRSLQMRQILTPNLRRLISIITVVTGAFGLIVFLVLQRLNWPIEEIRTAMFILLSVDSLFFAFSLKNLRQPIWRIDLFSNRYLLLSLLASFLLLLGALTITPIKSLVGVADLPWLHVFLIFLVGSFNLLVIETVKYLTFARGQDFAIIKNDD